MYPARSLIRILVVLLAAALAVSACSRVGIAYNTADLLVRGYAKDYLDLDKDQLAAWQPLLDDELARHRREELPYLAAYFDQLDQAGRRGFDAENTACLTRAFETLYRRQATFAVTLAAPLLAGLTPDQIARLEARFDREAEEDRADLSTRGREEELTSRARRYAESIEDWTGSLSDDQRLVIADITSRMPDTREALVEYRTRKREQLIALLRSDPDEGAVRGFMTDWLVDFTDLPPELDRAGDELGERIAELLIRLGAELDAAQRDRLHKRLAQLRDEMMGLQRQPTMAPKAC